MTKQKVKSKKSDKSKDASIASGSQDSKNTSSQALSPLDANPMSPPAHPPKPPNRVSFIPEIQSMMFALGDCKKPVYESASLVEDIVHHQMSVVLQRAADICTMRGARFISIEDFIFLMRKDHDKLRRLFQFLSFKDMGTRISRQISVEEEEDTTDELKTTQAKRRKLCQDILSSIDQTGELSSLLESEEVDAVKLERQDRADQKARGMDLNSYKEYAEARRINFIKKASKFKEWLDIGNLEPKPNAFAMEIVGYLAHETVAQIVDLSLLVQRDMLSSPCDPISKSMTPVYFSNLAPLATHPLQAKLKSASTTPPSTPSQSPVPSSPKSPTDKMVSPFLSSTNGNGNGGNLSASNNSNNSDSSSQSQGETKAPLTPGGTAKSKSKKKKKDRGASLPALSQYRAIQPNHIMEAMRRYTDVIQPMAYFSKYGSRGMKSKLLVS